MKIARNFKNTIEKKRPQCTGHQDQKLILPIGSVRIDDATRLESSITTCVIAVAFILRRAVTSDGYSYESSNPRGNKGKHRLWYFWESSKAGWKNDTDRLVRPPQGTLCAHDLEVALDKIWFNNGESYEHADLKAWLGMLALEGVLIQKDELHTLQVFFAHRYGDVYQKTIT